MLKPNYMLVKGTLAKSHCRTLDDGLLNRLALKDDVVLSECAKLKPPRPSFGIVVTLSMAGWLAPWMLGLKRLLSEVLTS